MLLISSSASAATSATYSGVSFGPDGTAGTSFVGLRSLTVDQVTEDVYAYDAAERKLYKFDAEGHPANFSALGTNVISGVGGGAGGTEYQVAIAPPGSPGGTAGDVYIANSSGALQIYNPDGTQLGELAAGGEICGVGVSPTGRLLLGIFPRVVEYTPTTNPPTLADQTGSSIVGPEAELRTCNVAADGLGNVYAASFLGRIKRLKGVADPNPTEVDPFASTLAVDPVTNELYADQGSAVAKYEPSGHLLFTFGGSGPGAISESRGIAVNATSGHAASGDVYVSSGSTNQVEIFKPIVFADVTVQPATAISESEATVHGSVNPDGGPPVTGCFFEYVAGSVFEESGFEHAATVNCAPPVPLTGSTAKPVEATISSLERSAVYHVRLVAENANGRRTSESNTFTTSASPYPSTGPLAPCANEAFRTGPGATLPDCRAYEQVTPVDKGGGSAAGSNELTRTSPSGDGITFYSQGGIAGGVGSQDFPVYLAVRAAGTWSTQGLLPPQSFGPRAGVLGYSTDLRFAVTSAGNFNTGFGLFIEDTLTHSIATAVPPQPAAEEPADYALDAVSADGSELLFESTAPLVAGVPPGKDNIYLWSRGSGAIMLVGVKTHEEGGGPFPDGSFGGPYDWAEGAEGLTSGGAMRHMYVGEANAISANGSRAYFTAGGTGQLYLRTGLGGPDPATAHVSGSLPGVTDPNGAQPAAFIQATPDGSSAIFMSSQKLTEDATTGPSDQGKDLYRYDANTGDLTDLVPDPTDPNGAEVKGVLGISPDGSSVYFVAGGALAPGATPVACNEGALCNLYHFQESASGSNITLITQLKGGDLFGKLVNDSLDWSPSALGVGTTPSPRTARVSRDGQSLLFASRRSLTGYNNRSSNCDKEADACLELYRYGARDRSLACVSCNPTGASPLGPAFVSNELINGELVTAGTKSAFLTRNLSASGNRVFFQTPDPLVSKDTNGTLGCPTRLSRESGSCMDVYEWEAPGTGSCQAPSANGGCLYLISTGQSNQPSYFADADEEGENVFFFTQSQLVPADRDQLFDVYDAREHGGLASQHQQPSPSCTGEECQGAATPPPTVAVAPSAAVSGPGNRKKRHKHKKQVHHRCPKKSGKCKRKHAPLKHHKRAAANKPGGSK
ncbi:MAG: hypothetical protein JST59_21045 [Actinobacteria bacterium]|nr:hypothetical protein [Actinomycetota bacterium]